MSESARERWDALVPVPPTQGQVDTYLAVLHAAEKLPPWKGARSRRRHRRIVREMFARYYAERSK